ncbi:YybH family protein [Kangiella shandongensis]|uniref:YybH family protein n=1 Tax=Kangiella shandongensis TaxID=2763258 RepID=UPI001CBE8041|nr:nuclear transport factor 2 family protein [Kangiella shandongensis]
MKLLKILSIALLLGLSSSVIAHGDKKPTEQNLFVGTDSAVGKVVEQLHQALSNGDTDTIKSILSDDVLIFEGSGAERSLAEYASHHMKSDIKFLSHMKVKLIERNIMVDGDIAISSSRSKVTGQYKDTKIDKVSIETLVLKKIGGAWKVVRIHWS